MGDPDRDLRGRRLGEFVVGERIGRGSHGVVYLAEQVGMGREAVVKIARGGGERDRFLTEARIASRLDHPYAAHVYAFGAEPDGLRWIAMERVRGSTLAALIAAHGALPLDRFVVLFERLCEVVHDVHEHGIVHRDIKPENVMVVSKAGRQLPKLLDLGVATLAGHGDDRRIGSPRYMAPEQWVRGAEVDRRSDLYGLGVLAYEALTGRLPFPATEIAELARAHARAAVPPVGDGLPPELDGFFAAALAKDRAARPETALALAATLRSAARLESSREALPQLAEPMREAWLARAPQPIAEAIAALESATHPHQAWDAAALVARVAVRWIGAIALAARRHAGAAPNSDGAIAPRRDPGAAPNSDGAIAPRRDPGAAPAGDDAMAPRRDAGAAPNGDGAIAPRRDPGAAPAGDGAMAARRDAGAAPNGEGVTAALRALQRRGLDDADWLALAHGLCGPVMRELHPLPELHAALCERRDVIAAAVAGIGPAPIDPSELVQRLPAAIRCVEELLGELAFVLDTPLAVVRDGRAERWIGLRRRRRVALPIGERPGIHERSVVLLDGDGAPVLVLDPLVQLAPPAPGAGDELFVLDGGDPRGARLVAWPRQYERHDDELWPWFAAHLLTSVEEVGPDVASERAPYLGLAPFTAGDAALYCGREREVEAFCNRLRDESLLAVVGPSGAGKSSFIHAGVVPALPEGWRAISVRPGRTPIATLVTRLRREGLLPEGSSAPASIARALCAQAGAPVVLVIDQFEELFTVCRDRAERERFARELAEAADAPDGAVRVVITLRDDFLVAAESMPALRDRLARGLRVLGTPSSADLRRILVDPARRAGYEFADPVLPDEMVAEVAGEAGALALLSFTAARLWELRDRGFRQLTRRAYESLGGVGGALARHADAVLAAMSPAERALCRDVLRQLVTAEGTRTAMSRAELDEVLGGRGHARSVIDSLIAARLITASETERGDDRIELVHETLIAAWPRLVAWRREDADGARLRDQLRAAARQWNDRGRTRGLLWRGDALLEYQLWRHRVPGALTDVEEAFARDSLADAARTRRRLRLAIGGAFVVLAVGLVVLFELRTAASRAAASARHRLIDNYEEQGRRALLEGDAQTALMFLDEAYQMGAEGAGLRFMLGRALDPVLAETATLPHGAKLWSVGFTPDGARVVTGGNDGTLVVWDAAGRRLFTAPGHGEGILRAAVSPDGALVACGGGNGVVEVLRVRDGTRVAELRGHAAAVHRVAWFPDGKRLASTSSDGTARIWDPGGAPAIALHHGGDKPTGLAISRDGSRIATGSFGDTIPSPDLAPRLWSGDGTLIAELHGHDHPVHALQFAPAGDRLLTAGLDGTARLWDAGNGRQLVVLRGHDNAVWDAAFFPDGERVVTASADQTARIWNARSGATLAILRGHRARLTRVAVTPDGASVITASADGSARVWNAASGLPVSSFAHAGMVFDLAVSPRGDAVATASWSGTAKLWSLAPRQHAAGFHVAGTAGREYDPAPALSPDDRYVARAEQTGVTVWEASGRVRAIGLGGPAVTTDPVFAQSWVIAGDRAGHVRAWDLAGIERLDVAAHAGAVAAIAATPRRVISTDDAGELAAIDLAAPHARHGRLPGPVARLAISSDGQRVAAVLADGRVALVDASDLHPIAVRTRDGEGELAFSPSGRYLATSAGPRTEVWRTGDGALVHTLDAERVPVFSADDALLAIGATDGTVRLWSTSDWTPRGDLTGHAGAVLALAFRGDGHLLVSTGTDRAAKIWDVDQRRMIFEAPGIEPLLFAAFAPSGERFYAGGHVRLDAWNARPLDLDRAPLARLVACRVPLRLEGSTLLAAEPHCDDAR